jgi:hypothetical protein
MTLSTITLPSHRFNYWTEVVKKHKPCVLIVGAGLSSDLAPRPDQLVRELFPRQESIQKNLQITVEFKLDANKPDTLYQWAEHCIDAIKERGIDENQAKRQFLDAIGLTSDGRFAAKANVPARGATPRHRVIARLAREGRIENVWSLNWDLWLEAAFDCVGMTAIQYASVFKNAFPRYWKTQYESWVPSTQPPEEIEENVTVFKPHGCIRSLHHGNPTFVITATELAQKRSGFSETAMARMTADLKGNALCVIGWSVSEPYIRPLFENLKYVHCLTGSLAIIDPNPNDDGHNFLINAYDKTNDESICKVQIKGFGTTDDLMLWIQLQRGLNSLKAACNGLNNIVNFLDAHLKEADFPYPNTSYLGWAASWFDSFLPVWLRLCFNCKAEIFMSAGAPVSHEFLPLQLRDAHVPWGDLDRPRKDLRAAALIYVKLAAAEKQHVMGNPPGK